MQISYADGLISYAFSTGTKACVTSADLIDSDENLHCFTRPLSSCEIKSLLCLSAGAQEEYRGFSIYQHTAFRVFFN